ncbi:hypothetical protein B0H10DRAFT_1952468 [Mycena sp. CBHHK59/15]|nr:hypothetical protein B0H10DRAFT_1952468 [Mycena sp. CBHHK59/15]
MKKTPVAPSLTTGAKAKPCCHGRRRDSDDENDNDNDNDGIPSFSLPNQNTVNAIQRYAERKRLRRGTNDGGDYLCERHPAVRDTKCSSISSISRSVLGKIVTSAPPYEVSAALEKNLPTTPLPFSCQARLDAGYPQEHRFDLPVGIENIPLILRRLFSAVQEAFTQLRSKFKRRCSQASRSTRATELAPGRQQQNIFKVTQVLVEGTQCSVSVELCARVALMRRTYLKDSGVKFWNTLDFDLAEIRAEAKGTPRWLRSTAFRHILAQDQTKHGVKDYEITETGVNEFQQTVNDLIDAGAADVASSVQGDAEE